MCASPHVYFSANQGKCRELDFTIPNKAGHVFRLMLQCLDALQGSAEAKAQLQH